jgi:ADP-ribosylglycohydrolase
MSVGDTVGAMVGAIVGAVLGTAKGSYVNRPLKSDVLLIAAIW